jgi:general secretion pathway protein A
MVEAETAEYIRHRLRVAGGNADVFFEPEVMREVHRLSLGISRLINTLCDTALMACKVDSEFRVTGRVARGPPANKTDRSRSRG